MPTFANVAGRWTVAPMPVHDAVAAGLLLDYFRDIVGRYYGRPATHEEVAKAMADDPSDGISPPHGVFLVAELDGVPSGCAGLRTAELGYGELTRVFVRHAARGLGGGAVLLAGIDAAARAAGVHTVRLDTRADLVEARALYARNGYQEVPAFNTGPYREHWFAKRLS